MTAPPFTGRINHTMKTTLIIASDIRPGDRVQLDSGEWVAVIETSDGGRPGSTLVEWKREPGEGCGGFRVQPGEHIAVQRAAQQP